MVPNRYQIVRGLAKEIRGEKKEKETIKERGRITHKNKLEKAPKLFHGRFMNEKAYFDNAQKKKLELQVSKCDI